MYIRFHFLLGPENMIFTGRRLQHCIGNTAWGGSYFHLSQCLLRSSRHFTVWALSSMLTFTSAGKHTVWNDLTGAYNHSFWLAKKRQPRGMQWEKEVASLFFRNSAIPAKDVSIYCLDCSTLFLNMLLFWLDSDRDTRRSATQSSNTVSEGSHCSVSDSGFQLSPSRCYQFPSVTPGHWIES